MMRKVLIYSSLLGILASFQGVAQEGEVEEIVVTARKRTETLQDVPLSVSALSAQEIAKIGIQDINGLYARVPGLYFAGGSITTPTSAFNYLTIRGVGWNAGLEPSIGTFVDGMYTPQIGYDLAFLDLERIEVLRGPQGTLFGRNTQGGALNIVTRKPDEEFRGKMRVEYAENNTIRASASMSGQIAENVFAGGSFEYAKTDGYINNVVLNRHQDNSERLSARGIIRWTPTSDLDVVVIGDASIKTFNEMMRGAPVALGESYSSFADEVDDDQVDNVGVQMNIEYNLNETFTLKSISGYRKSKHDIENDTDSRVTNQDVAIFDAIPPITSAPTAVSGATTPFELSQRFVSQELQLFANHGNLDWMGGFYYFDQHSSEQADRYLGPGVRFPFAVYINSLGLEDRDGWAIYGNANYRMLDERLELTFGARYSEEDVETGGHRVMALLGGPFATTTPAFTDRDGEQNGNNFSIMASISYDFSDDILGYATYSEGWKAGGVNRNPTTTQAVVPYEDESSENYEIGVKTSWLNDRFTLNAALFWIELTDQQLVNFVPPPPGTGGTPQTVVDNAASSRVRGVEFELNARVSDNFNINATFAYNDTEFKDFIRVFNPTDSFDMSGLDFEEVPEITANLSGAYRVPVAMFGGSEIELYVNYRSVGKVTQQDNFAGAVSSDQSYIPSYDRLDTRLSLIHNSWRLTAYVDNVLDSYDVTDKSSDPYFGGAVAEYQRPLEPRQFGVVISKTF